MRPNLGLLIRSLTILQLSRHITGVRAFCSKIPHQLKFASLFATPTLQQTCGMADKPYDQMTDADWKAKGLSNEAIKVTRHAGTERAFTSPLYKHKESGVYHCVCCGAPLFKSDHKFQSDCGWPAFYADSFDAMIEREDYSFGMRRVEVLCKTCGAHLGHKFDDAKYHNRMVPVDTRYCINGVSLEFHKEN